MDAKTILKNMKTFLSVQEKKVDLATMVTVDGIGFFATAFEVGNQVQDVNGDAITGGTYTMEDGMVLVLDGEGVITEVTAATDGGDPDPEVEMKEVEIADGKKLLSVDFKENSEIFILNDEERVLSGEASYELPTGEVLAVSADGKITKIEMKKEEPEPVTMSQVEEAFTTFESSLMEKLEGMFSTQKTELEEMIPKKSEQPVNRVIAPEERAKTPQGRILQRINAAI